MQELTGDLLTAFERAAPTLGHWLSYQYGAQKERITALEGRLPPSSLHIAHGK